MIAIVEYTLIAIIIAGVIHGVVTCLQPLEHGELEAGLRLSTEAAAMVLIDTNVVSELMRPNPAPEVLAWLNTQI